MNQRGKNFLGTVNCLDETTSAGNLQGVSFTGPEIEGRE